MALTAKNMPYKHGFGPFAPEVYRVPMAYPLPLADRPGDAGAEAAAQAIDQIDKQIGADNVAAIIIEPILGEGGFIVPAKGFLPALAECAGDNGIVFVADEIQSGFCRTGEWFACEHEGIVPDLITTAKGIAGGLPLAAVTGRAEIMDAVHAGGLGGTYGGNPVACAAALGAIETMRGAGPRRRPRRIEAVMLPRLRALAEQYAGHRRRPRPRRHDRHRAGQAGTTGARPGGHRGGRQGLPPEGVLVLTCGTYGNVLRFLPPLVIGEDLLNEGLRHHRAGVHEPHLTAGRATAGGTANGSMTYWARMPSM